MNDNSKVAFTAVLGLALTAAIGFAAVNASSSKTASNKSSEAQVVTNENGSVSRSFTECTITTNGSMVTEHRRETRTTMDTKGNLLESSTSEYAQSYPVTDAPSCTECKAGAPSKKAEADSFLSLKFGEEFKGTTNFVVDAEEPTLLRATFTPKKPLAGFDDYYVYVTPTTHKVVKIFACAKDAVEPGARWRRHYLIEALEKKYGAWARLASYWKPLYAFDLENGRQIRVCLAGANEMYETVIAAWDEAMINLAYDEMAAIREQARKNAAEKRRSRVDDAASAF